MTRKIRVNYRVNYHGSTDRITLIFSVTASTVYTLWR